MRKCHAIIGLIAISCLWASPARAAEIVALSAAYADVKAAVDAAQPGDTVRVPAGTHSWGSRLAITKSISIIGAGIGRTIINSTYAPAGIGEGSELIPEKYLITIIPENPADNPAIRLSGFTFNFGTTSYGILYNNSSTIYDCTKVRLDHLSISVFYPSKRLFLRHGLAHGVMDNCIMNGRLAAGGSPMLWTTNGWEYGTASNFYFEDNTWTMEWPTAMECMGTYGAARYAWRYNTITIPTSSQVTPLFDQHGNQYNVQPSAFGAEIYNNTIITSGNNNETKFFDQRGGKSLVYNNRVIWTSGGGISTKIREEHPDNQGSGVAINAINGQPQHISDTYYWNNTGNGALFSPTIAANVCTGLSSKSGNAPSLDGCYHNAEILNGTATGGSTTTLIDTTKNFISAGVVVGNWVINITNANDRYYPEIAQIDSIGGTNNNMLTFTGAMHFVNANTNKYRIVAAIGGLATGGSTTTLIDMGKNFVIAGVNVGDWVVNVTNDGYTYRTAAQISSISTTTSANDTLTFSAMDIANENGDVYYVVPPTHGISFDRDLWVGTTSFNGTSGVGYGVFENRPTNCVPGVGYWATDEKKLYRCTSINIWTVYYTPYPYPHPLRISGSLADDGLTLLSPNGGEIWRLGEPHNITWNANNVSGNLVIELLQNDVVAGTITSSVDAATGSFTWTVGQLANGSFVTGQNLKIRISSAAGTVLVEQEIQ